MVHHNMTYRRVDPGRRAAAGPMMPATLARTQHAVEDGEQFVDAERFGQAGIRAQYLGEAQIVLLHVGCRDIARHGDDANAGRDRANLADRLDTLFVGHDDIRDHDRAGIAAKLPDAGDATGRVDHVMSRVLQHARHGATHLLVVIDD